jgi:AcrR family transcriptional regulator
MSVTLTARKVPRQLRSRMTVATIIDAAANLLQKSGPKGLNTNAVADRAGFSIGSLYQYFPNKEAIVGELWRRHAEAMVDILERTVAETSAEDDLSKVISIAVGGMVDAHRCEADLQAPLRSLTRNLPFPDWVLPVRARRHTAWKQLLERHSDEIAVRDLDLAAFMVDVTVREIGNTALEREMPELRSGILTNEVTRLVLAYLKTP